MYTHVPAKLSQNTTAAVASPPAATFMNIHRHPQLFSAWLVKEIIFTLLEHCAHQYDFPVGLTVSQMNIHYDILLFFE